MASRSGEKVIKQANSNVKFKKVEGKFALMENRIAWTPLDQNGKSFQCSYSDIKVQRISPDTSSKVQLQIVFHNDSSYNFHFVNGNGRHAEVKDRDEIKDKLAELLPQHRQKTNKDLEEKNRIFKEKPELFQLYKDLVVSGIITSEEFWENQNVGLSKQNKESEKQDVGIASGFLAELKPDMHGCNELRFNLTADNINAIFKMYPGVKKRYMDTVPTEVTEKEFWTEFFQSQYFHRDRIQKSSSRDVFGELAKKDEDAHLKKVIENFCDPLIDFNSSQPISDEGYGSGFKQRANNETLMKQFNHQSLMVLNNLKRKPGEESTEGKRETRKKRIREALELRDLESRPLQKTFPLNVIDTNKFSNQSTKSNGHKNGSTEGNVTSFMSRVQSWTPQLSSTMNSQDAKRVLQDLSSGGRLMPTTDNSNDRIPAHLKIEMKKNYNSLAELLRHFWSCFPIRNPQLEEKVRRMATSIEKYRDSKLANFICMQPSSNNKLGHHMSQMIDVALKKYRAWEERRSAKSIKM